MKCEYKGTSKESKPKEEYCNDWVTAQKEDAWHWSEYENLSGTNAASVVGRDAVHEVYQGCFLLS
jgi:hypothetical protein